MLNIDTEITLVCMDTLSKEATGAIFIYASLLIQGQLFKNLLQILFNRRPYFEKAMSYGGIKVVKIAKTHGYVPIHLKFVNPLQIHYTET